MSKIVVTKTYINACIALMLLLVLTVGAAYLDLGALNFAIAMAISVSKALLIILVFMHVRYSSPVVQLAASAGFVWLLILFVLTMSDYVTRNWVGP
jgi:cytochrome c oxidase subunit 4